MTAGCVSFVKASASKLHGRRRHRGLIDSMDIGGEVRASAGFDCDFESGLSASGRSDCNGGIEGEVRHRDESETKSRAGACRWAPEGPARKPPRPRLEAPFHSGSAGCMGQRLPLRLRLDSPRRRVTVNGGPGQEDAWAVA